MHRVTLGRGYQAVPKLPTIMTLFKHETERHVWTRIDNYRQRTGNTGYPAKLFPMEVQVAFYRHNPTTRTSLTTAAIGSLLLVGLLGSLGGLAGDLLGGGGLGTERIRMLPDTVKLYRTRHEDSH